MVKVFTLLLLCPVKDFALQPRWMLWLTLNAVCSYETKTGWTQNVSGEPDHTPNAAALLNVVSHSAKIQLWFVCCEKARKSVAVASVWERSTAADILCKLRRKRTAKNHLLYIGSGRKRRHVKVPLKRGPTRLWVSTCSHEARGKLLLARSHGR